MEAAVAAGVLALALTSVFSFNSACLRLVRNAKESSAAMLSNQQRVEQLRSCNWSNITDSIHWGDTKQSSYWQASIMNAPTQSGAALLGATETVRVTENGFLQSGSPSYFEIIRVGTNTRISASSSPEKLVTSRMLKVLVTLNWNTLGGRSRSRASTAIIAKGGLTTNDTATIAPTFNW